MRSSGEGGEALVRALETIEGLQLSEKVRIGFGSGRREGNGFVDVAIVARDGSLTF